MIIPIIVLIALIFFAVRESNIEKRKISTQEELKARKIKNRKKSLKGIFYTILIGVVLFLIMKIVHSFIPSCVYLDSNCFVLDMFLIAYMSEVFPVLIVWFILRYFI